MATENTIHEDAHDDWSGRKESNVNSHGVDLNDIKLGDKVELTVKYAGKIHNTTGYIGINWRNKDGLQAQIIDLDQVINVKHLSADPENWPPKLGDTWEADGNLRFATYAGASSKRFASHQNVTPTDLVWRDQFGEVTGKIAIDFPARKDHNVKWKLLHRRS